MTCLCPSCNTLFPPGAFTWSHTDEIQQAAHRSWYPFDLTCCLTCHELNAEAKHVANVVHDAWLDTWGPHVRRPPSDEVIEGDFLEAIAPYFKNTREKWVDDYKRVAIAFAITNDAPELDAVRVQALEYNLFFPLHKDLKAISHFRCLKWLASALNSTWTNWT